MSWAAKPLVEVDGGVDLLHDLGGTAGEAAAPHPVAHAVAACRLQPDDRHAPDPSAASRRRRRRAGRRRSSARRPIRDELRAGQQRAARVPGREAGRRAPRAARAGRGRGVEGRAGARGRCRLSPSTGPTARPMTLADFKGRTVLLNLWATWCVALPPGDAGARQAPGRARRAGFRGRRGQYRHAQPRQAEALAASTTGVDAACLLRRPAGQGLPGPAPASARSSACRPRCLIDPQGCELASLSGPAEWASEDALRLVRAALGRS